MPSRKESGFARYQHVERLGTPLVKDIEVGSVYMFPKLDGANSSVWMDGGGGGIIRTGSRNRVCTLENDNQGFCDHIMGEGGDSPERRQEFREIFACKPDWHIFGEWLVPHTLKTYRDHAWRRFYVFDVYDHGAKRWVKYDDYATYLLDEYSITTFEVIPPLAVVEHPALSDFIHARDNQNTYLIKDESGVGEGIAIKNYDWVNAHGHQIWAKLVRGEFKDDNRKVFGHLTKEGLKDAAVEIAQRIVTPELVDKELAKIKHEICGDHFGNQGETISEEEKELYCASREARRSLIPRLLSQVYHCVITEELWNELKRLKNPTVDFKRLNQICTAQIKKFNPGLFG